MSAPFVTPLLRFLRCLTTDQRKAFAEAVGTTQVYLYQMAGQTDPNPRLRLALAIRAESARMARKVHAKALTLEDLLVGVPADEPERTE